MKTNELVRELFATMHDWSHWHYNAKAIRNGASLWIFVPSLVAIWVTVPIGLLLGHRRNCNCSEYPKHTGDLSIR